MKIYCYTKSPLKLEGGQIVNKLGSYMYKNLSGAIKKQNSGNMCDIYFLIYYQVPLNKRDHRISEDYNDMHEMTLNLNITTYQEKIRVNILEVSPDELTLGCKTFKYDCVNDLEKFKNDVMKYVEKRVSNVYEEYDFVF